MSRQEMKPFVERAKFISSISPLLIISNLILLICFSSLSNGAPTPEVASSHRIQAASSDLVESVIQPIAAASSPASSSSSAIGSSRSIASPSLSDIDETPSSMTKVSPKETQLVDHLQTQETGYLHGHAPSYHSPDNGYQYDKNAYGKQAQDWSLYDQGKSTGRSSISQK